MREDARRDARRGRGMDEGRGEEGEAASRGRSFLFHETTTKSPLVAPATTHVHACRSSLRTMPTPLTHRPGHHRHHCLLHCRRYRHSRAELSQGRCFSLCAIMHAHTHTHTYDATMLTFVDEEYGRERGGMGGERMGETERGGGVDDERWDRREGGGEDLSRHGGRRLSTVS